MHRVPFRSFLAAVGVVAIAACSASGSKPTAAAPQTLTVFAASSLTEAFDDLGAQFAETHDGAKVQFSFGSSSQLAAQIGQGAPADVFASADTKNMQSVVDAGEAAGTPTDIARNTLTIAVEAGNPKHVTTLADLARSELVVVLCDPTAPCGKFADQVLRSAKVTVAPKSREVSAKATLAKVELGEADAAIVYRSDVASSKKVVGVAIPDSVNVTTTLPIVRLAATKRAALADEWIAFVVAHRSELVSKYGFLPL